MSSNYNAASSRHSSSSSSNFSSESDFVSARSTPATSVSPHRHYIEDLPPTYEQVQAENLDPVGNEEHHLSINDHAGVNDLRVHRLVLDDNETYTLPSAEDDPGPNAPAYSVSDPDGQLLDQALQFARHQPDPDARCHSRTSLPFTLSPEEPELSNQTTIPFARAYSKALHAHGISSTKFVAFLDGLNIVSSASPADLSSPEPSDSQPLALAYLSRANAAFFAPRGLQVRLATLSAIIDGLDVPSKFSRTTLLARAASPTADAIDRAQMLEPWVEPLDFSVPEPSAATIELRQMAAQLPVSNRRRWQTRALALGLQAEAWSRDVSAQADALGRTIALRAETYGRGTNASTSVPDIASINSRFEEQVKAITAKAEAELTDNKTHYAEISRSKQRALEKAAQEKTKAEVKLEALRLKAEIEIAKKEAKKAAKAEKKALKGSKCAERCAEKKRAREERREAKREAKEVRRAAKVGVGEERNMVWLVVENLKIEEKAGGAVGTVVYEGT
ncbi:hypothetical protein H2199_001076 [Coniosporium tulheliwenetii]|uniref:Uncharacterized protein n=1 Tax=Coniosporium tulheliwenetii TaxID=3383036 RepID=A0ACC2ZKU7_9PEZI|nr:hypothetical protein H2199_001076 [Cladosporium sp. JES 115]